MPALPSLPALDRAIVEMLALLFESSTKSTLARAISSARCVGRAPRLPDLEARLDALTAEGLTVADGGGWALADSYVHDVTLEIARRGDLDRFAAAVRVARPTKVGYGRPVGSYEEGIREVRFALYSGRWPEALQALNSIEDPWPDLARTIDPPWLDTLPADMANDALVKIADHATTSLTPCDPWMARLSAVAPEELTDDQHHFLVGRRLLEGRFEEARRLASGRSSVHARVDLAWLLVVSGDAAAAIPAYEKALTEYLKEFGKRARFFPDRAGLFFVVALLAVGDVARAKTFAEAGRTKGVSAVPNGHALLSWATTALGSADIEEKTCPIPGRGWDPVEVLLYGLVHRWLGLPGISQILVAPAAQAEAGGLRWLSTQLDRCLVVGKPPVGADLSTLLRRPDRSSHALGALEALAAGTPAPGAAPPPDRDLRLIWVIKTSPYWTSLAPLEQTRGKAGWSKGRPVALKRLFHESRGMDHLSAADRAACATITEEVSAGPYRDVSYNLTHHLALRALAGEPNLFAEHEGALIPAVVRQVQPRLRAEPHAGSIRLTLTPSPASPERDMSIARVGPGELEIVEFQPIHHAIAGILGKNPLDVRAEEEPRVRALLSALSARLPVEADLGGAAATAPADAAPTFEIRRHGFGLAIEAVVYPFGATGPRVRPGSGGRQVYAEADGRRVRVDRDLEEEQAQLGHILDACPTLRSGERWLLADREPALEALSELHAASAQLRWPDHDPIALDELGVADLDLSLSTEAGGFVVKGRLRGVELGQLLAFLSASPGRFLGDSHALLALTAELRHRLNELRALSDAEDRLRFHALRLPLVDALLEGARVKADKGWRSMVARLTTSGDDPAVPSTLRGELRPYQADGFRWLARLGRWGVGACLADDMGLGKTVQVIALLLTRAAEGPCLIVAPTSVLSNWAAELLRFAPTLQVRTLSGPRRDSALRGLGPFDVVLTSYAVLPLEVDGLAKVRFAVAVLDEAQAIKNPETTRARAAFALAADQRIATTGTPVENRLGDLWSLFRFLNPGLLGSAADFERRFTRPIEKDGSRASRDRLRRLVAPFLLRRTKSEVLPELPARTEVSLPIELNAEEIGLYEAIRAETLEKLAQESGPRRLFTILAGLTRLRRAASHARMVLADAPTSSSKLAVLTEILDDIVPRGHKALVFSQFVDHLQLAREAVLGMGLRCQYLDGSTSAPARKLAIDAFQGGDGDVFLISLKAGGVGLNLTAADYVIHLDPWWNPAAEDQASDRSHRIGQTRPVTIYRLVARDTVEDHIVALHHRKRELAAGVLEGTDAVAAMSEAELLDLLRPPSAIPE